MPALVSYNVDFNLQKIYFYFDSAVIDVDTRYMQSQADATTAWQDISFDPTTAADFISIALGPDVYLATTGTRFFYSQDAVNWAETSWPFAVNRVTALIYAFGRFVAITDSTASNNIYTSVNGVSWSLRSTGITTQLYRARFSDDRIVILGGANTPITSAGVSVITSPDASNFIRVIYPTASQLLTPRDILSESGSYYVLATGQNTSTDIIVIYANGTWQEIDTGLNNQSRTLLYKDGNFILVGLEILTAGDPAGPWTSRYSFDAGNAASDGTATNTQIVLVGNDGIILSSANGTSWAQEISPTARNLTSLAFNSNQLVAAGAANTVITQAGALEFSTKLPFVIPEDNPQLAVVDLRYSQQLIDIVLTPKIWKSRDSTYLSFSNLAATLSTGPVNPVPETAAQLVDVYVGRSQDLRLDRWYYTSGNVNMLFDFPVDSDDIQTRFLFVEPQSGQPRITLDIAAVEPPGVGYTKTLVVTQEQNTFLGNFPYPRFMSIQRRAARDISGADILARERFREFNIDLAYDARNMTKAANIFVNTDAAVSFGLADAVGNVGEVLTSNGPNSAPTWQSGRANVSRVVAGGGIVVSPATGIGDVVISRGGGGSLWQSPANLAVGDIFLAGFANAIPISGNIYTNQAQILGNNFQPYPNGIANRFFAGNTDPASNTIVAIDNTTPSASRKITSIVSLDMGRTWRDTTLPQGGREIIYSLQYTASQFVAGSQGYVLTSRDGINWVTSPYLNYGSITFVTYIPQLRIYLLTISSRLFYSRDLATVTITAQTSNVGVVFFDQRSGYIYSVRSTPSISNPLTYGRIIVARSSDIGAVTWEEVANISKNYFVVEPRPPAVIYNSAGTDNIVVKLNYHPSTNNTTPYITGFLYSALGHSGTWTAAYPSTSDTFFYSDFLGIYDSKLLMQPRDNYRLEFSGDLASLAVASNWYQCYTDHTRIPWVYLNNVETTGPTPSFIKGNRVYYCQSNYMVALNLDTSQVDYTSLISQVNNYSGDRIREINGEIYNGLSYIGKLLDAQGGYGNTVVSDWNSRLNDIGGDADLKVAMTGGGSTTLTFAVNQGNSNTWPTTVLTGYAGLQSLDYGGNVLVVVGSSGNILSGQYTGPVWDPVTLASNVGYQAVASGSRKFMAVANTTSFYYGRDLDAGWQPPVAWSLGSYRTLIGPWRGGGAIGSGTSRTDWADITYGRGRFVAISGNSSASNVFSVLTRFSIGGVYVSFNYDPLINLIGFSSATVPVTAQWSSIIFGDRFVAVARTGETVISTNALNWTVGGMLPATTGTWRAVAWGDSMYVAVSAGTTDAAYSPDGLTWTSSMALPSSQNWSSIAWGQGAFVAVARGTTNTIARSTNGGMSWSEVVLPLSGDWISVRHGDNKFVTISNNSDDSLISTDAGVTWTRLALPEVGNWTALAYSEVGKFIALRSGNLGAAALRPGIQWTPRSSATTNDFTRVKYLREPRVFYAMGVNGTLLKSTDGVAWFTVDPGTADPVIDITYGLGYYLIITRVSGINQPTRVFYSTNGEEFTIMPYQPSVITTYTQPSSNNYITTPVEINFVNNCFVIVWASNSFAVNTDLQIWQVYQFFAFNNSYSTFGGYPIYSLSGNSSVAMITYGSAASAPYAGFTAARIPLQPLTIPRTWSDLQDTLPPGTYRSLGTIQQNNNGGFPNGQTSRLWIRLS